VNVVYNKIGASEFTESLKVDLRWTIAEAKAKIAKALRLDTESIHLRRSAKSSQLKEEQKTLLDLSLIDGSPLFVAEGRVRSANEVLIKLYLYTPEKEKGSVMALFQTPIDQNATIRDVKSMLAGKLSLLKGTKEAHQHLEILRKS